jgi:hypothetical protein
MPIPAFQFNAFQHDTFQVWTRIPTPVIAGSGPRVEFEVMQPMRVIRAGSEAYIRAKVWDMTQTPAVLFNPSTSMEVKLTKPDGSLALDWTAMDNESVGQYIYVWQTTGDMLKGVYVAEFKTANGTEKEFSFPVAVFQLA